MKKEIHSPHYPSNYGKNLDCTWTLTSSFGKRIILKNVDIEQIEECGKERCTCDYLEIFKDPNSAKKSVPQKLCGTKKIPKLLSVKNVLKLHFHSDGNSMMKGFKLTYDVV